MSGSRQPSRPPLGARTVAWLLAGVVALGGLVGCGSAPPSQPSTPTVSVTATPLGPRPANLAVTGVDPCRLLTAAQAGALRVSATDGADATSCQWSNHAGTPDLRYTVHLYPDRGADYALRSLAPRQVVTVAGFPAVQTSSGDQDPAIHCLLFLDVAPGQSLQVLFANIGGDYPGITHDIACGLARAAAADMVGNLHH